VTEIAMIVAFVFRQPEEFKCMETTTCGVDIPMEVTGFSMLSGKLICIITLLNKSQC